MRVRKTDVKYSSRNKSKKNSVTILLYKYINIIKRQGQQLLQLDVKIKFKFPDTI